MTTNTIPATLHFLPISTTRQCPPPTLNPPTPPPQPSRSFTSFERIQELNEIDKSIPQLLQAAGLAIQILGSSSSATTLTSAKAQFLESVTTYFTILSSIDVRLRRQVYALQEAGLIAEGDAKDAKRGASASAAAAGGISGGGGQLDLSWLNSREDQVEKEMEREVWRRAKDFVEKLVGQANGDGRLERDGETTEKGVMD